MKWIGQWTIETYTNFYSASAKRWHLGQVLLHWRSITKVVVTQVLTTVTLRSLESLTTVTGLRTRHQSALRPLRRVLQMPATWRARGKTSWKRVGNGIKAWNSLHLASLGSQQAILEAIWQRASGVKRGASRRYDDDSSGVEAAEPDVKKRKGGKQNAKEK